MNTPDNDVLIRFSGERQSINEFKNLTVHSSATGGDIKLGDIAKIRKVFDKEFLWVRLFYEKTTREVNK